MIKLTVNGREHQLDLDPNIPLLWALRDHIGLTGTSYGCGMAHCGACTLYPNGAPIRSCSTPLAAANALAAATGRRLLDIGSKRPAEIALSILAGITAARNRAAGV